MSTDRNPHGHQRPSSPKTFQTTHWSVILKAKDGWPHADAALEELCRSYWAPVYAFLRRMGHKPHDAEDLVQSFFVHLLKREFLRNVAPEHGLFRSFLLRAVKNFALNQLARNRAAKRGGDSPTISLDGLIVENAERFEPASGDTPEHAFERRWALTILERALARLENEHIGLKSAQFAALRPWLTGNPPLGSYGSVAQHLLITEAAARVAVHRLRARYGDLVRDEVSQTVSDSTEVESEIRYLLALINR